MKPFVAARNAILVAALLMAGASPVIAAAHRSGTALDEPTHARPTAPGHGGAVTPGTPSGSDDDSPCLRPGPGIAGVSRAEAMRANTRSLPPAAPDRRSEKRERGHAATSNQLHRPSVQRSKSALRNTPATPGMGLLLRFGTNAGQEISYLVDPMTPAACGLRSGRAPPRASPLPEPAPAALPRSQHLANLSRETRPAHGALATQLRFHHELDPNRPGLPPFLAHACAWGIPAFAYLEPRTGSRAARMKGTTARSSTPFGGSDT